MKIENDHVEYIYYRKNDKGEFLRELDPEQILTLVLRSIYELIDIYKGKDLSTISIICEPDTAICFDRNSGKAISEAIMKHDDRCKDYFTELLRKRTKKFANQHFTDYDDYLINKFKEKTGRVLSHLSSATKLSYLMHVDPKVENEKGNEMADLVYCTLDSYLLFKLTSKFETSLTMAGSTQLVDICANAYRWDEELLEFYDIHSNNRPRLPCIKCSRWQYGLIALDLKTSGFYKESDEEAKFKTMRDEINNKYIARYDITSKNVTTIDRKLGHLDQNGVKMEFVKSDPNFSEDIPNMYLSNVKNLKFLEGGTEDLNVGLKRKIESMKIYIDGLLPYASALMLGHYTHQKLSSLIEFEDSLAVYTYLDGEFKVSPDQAVETMVCMDYVQPVKQEMEAHYAYEKDLKMRKAKANQTQLARLLEEEENLQHPIKRYDYFVENFDAKDNQFSPNHHYYNKQSNLQKFWVVKYMFVAGGLGVKEIFEQVTNTLKVVSKVEQVSDLIMQVKLEKTDHFYYVWHLGQGCLFNLKPTHTAYHISSAMVRVINYESFLLLFRIYSLYGLKCYNFDTHPNLDHIVKSDSESSLDSHPPTHPSFKLVDIVCTGRFKIDCEYLVQRTADMLNKKLKYVNSKYHNTMKIGAAEFLKSYHLKTCYLEDHLSSSNSNYHKYDIVLPQEIILDKKDTHNKTDDEIFKMRAAYGRKDMQYQISGYIQYLNFFKANMFLATRDKLRYAIQTRDDADRECRALEDAEKQQRELFASIEAKLASSLKGAQSPSKTAKSPSKTIQSAKK